MDNLSARRRGPPWVYFAQEDTAGGNIKIGFTTKHPETRLRDMRTGNPHNLRMLLAIPGGQREETAFHVIFAATRHKGEWFRPSRRLLAFIDEERRNNPDAIRAAGDNGYSVVEKSATLVDELRASLASANENHALALDMAKVARADADRALAENTLLRAERVSAKNPAVGPIPADWTLRDLLEHVEDQAIRSALAAFDGARDRTSRRLGISQTTLWRKMAVFGIRPEAETPSEQEIVQAGRVEPIIFSGKSRSENLADLKAATRARLGRR